MTSIPITFPGVAPTAQPTFGPKPPSPFNPAPPTYVPEPPAPFDPSIPMDKGHLPPGAQEFLRTIQQGGAPKPPSPFNPAPPTYVPEPPAPFDPAPKGSPEPAPPPFNPTPQYVPEPPVVPSMGMPPMGQSPVSQIAQILAAIQNPSNGMPMVLGGMPGVASPTGAPVGRPMVLGGMPLSPYNSDAFPVGGTPRPRQGAPMGLANLLRRFQRAGGRSQLDGLRSKYSGGY